MKSALCAVILVAMGAAGLLISQQYRRREQLLSQLLRDLRRLEEQVRLGRPVLQALQQGDMPLFSHLLKDVGESGLQRAWQTACSDPALAALESPERQAMDRFWDDMGMLDRHSQMDRFAETRDILSGLHAQALEESLKRSRLYGSLGLLLGLAAVVLLW